MAQELIYPGSSSFFPGQTPFGIYDDDYVFQEDAPKVALWCARSCLLYTSPSPRD